MTTNVYKLSVYLKQIETVEAMTQQEWLEAYTNAPQDMQYMPKVVWLEHLKQCALSEASAVLQEELKHVA